MNGQGFQMLAGDLTYVNASYKSMHGRIVSNWQIDQKDTFTWHVTIPANTTAAVYVPKSGMQNLVVKESGKVIWKDGAFVRGVAGISDARENKKGIIFTVASGSYTFERECKD